VPKGTVARPTTELALEPVDQILGWHLPRLPVVADAAHGHDFVSRSLA
jgi:hypothetical protein